ncbi:MAG: hypothetical protein WDN45_10915 [Caulobacteraceae bacterium]
MQPPVTTGDDSRRDVRVPDTVPNISGTWVARTSNRTIAPLDGGPTPFLPWAQVYFDERAAAEKSGMPLFDTNASCLPSGVPRVLPVPYPLDIVQTPDLTMIAVEVMHSFRIVHMDNKPPPADYKPSYLGYSRGYWDGDTLVVTTTGMNGFTQVDEEGPAQVVPDQGHRAHPQGLARHPGEHLHHRRSGDLREALDRAGPLRVGA